MRTILHRYCSCQHDNKLLPNRWSVSWCHFMNTFKSYCPLCQTMKTTTTSSAEARSYICWFGCWLFPAEIFLQLNASAPSTRSTRRLNMCLVLHKTIRRVLHWEKHSFRPRLKVADVPSDLENLSLPIYNPILVNSSHLCWTREATWPTMNRCWTTAFNACFKFTSGYFAQPGLNATVDIFWAIGSTPSLHFQRYLSRNNIKTQGQFPSQSHEGGPLLAYKSFQSGIQFTLGSPLGN